MACTFVFRRHPEAKLKDPRIHATPDVERNFCFQSPRVRQVVRIKDEGLPFSVKDPAKGPLAPAVSVPVVHIDDVEIACDHEVAYVTSLLSEFLLFSECCGRV